MRNKLYVMIPVLLVLVGSSLLLAFQSSNANGYNSPQINHIVVIFQENVSFDHYFGTYPYATNPSGEPQFNAAPGTPYPNNYLNSPALSSFNPNGVNPTRLDRSQALTCDNDHDYTAEQQAYNGGLVNNFVTATGCSPIVMDYYDGNTVTALWQYAQHFTLGDNFFGTTFGPSTPGAINLISGQTHGATPCSVPDTVSSTCTILGDADPTFDGCSSGATEAMTGTNIGDLLNAAGITWGWFQGGFAPSSRTSTGQPVCGTSHDNIGGASVPDYSAHHEPFQYYKDTSNPLHLPPSSVWMIGKTDQANHQYDLSSFYASIQAGNMPQLSFIKAPKYQDGHAGYSDPIDEQNFLIGLLNFLQTSPVWKNTAVLLTYDDSDGWYDHVMPPIVSQSNDPQYDALLGPTGLCGNAAATGSFQDQCGYGPRLPVLVISSWSRSNFILNTLTDQTSILRFIEDNWNLGRIGGGSFDAKAGSLLGAFDFSRPANGPLWLDPSTGEPTHFSPSFATITYNGVTYTTNPRGWQ